MKKVSYKYHQYGAVSDLVALILVVFAFVLGLLAAKAF